MQLQTILHRVQPYKSFVYRQARFRDGGAGPALDVQVEARANGRPTCSGCGQKRPGYDRLAARRFQFVPLWGIAVYFVYALRRVECPRCGVKVERVPGRHRHPRRRAAADAPALESGDASCPARR